MLCISANICLNASSASMLPSVPTYVMYILMTDFWGLAVNKVVKELLRLEVEENHQRKEKINCHGTLHSLDGLSPQFQFHVLRFRSMFLKFLVASQNKTGEGKFVCGDKKNPLGKLNLTEKIVLWKILYSEVCGLKPWHQVSFFSTHVKSHANE